MSEVITITSGKGGVGKSTATANIAVGLAQMGQKVVAVDFDIGLRNLDMILGLENRIVYDVIDVMEGNCKLAQALIQDKRTPNLHFLPASQSKDKNILDKSKVQNLIEELKKSFDYILLDSPAGIEGGFEHSIFWADRVLVVVTPEVSSVRDSDRVIGLINAKSHKASEGIKIPLHLIINRIKPELVESGKMISTQDVLKTLAIELIGLVPEDDKVVTATNKGEPVIYDKNSISGECYKRIVARVLGDEVEFVEFKSSGGLLKALGKIFNK